MASVRKSAIVTRSCESMFALVDGVERYPEFLPWCPRAHVLERDDAITVARIDIDYHGLKTAFTTRNRKEFPSRMQLELEQGPFERFTGEWSFTSLGAQGCRVELHLDYAMRGALAGRVLAGVFGQIAESLVERFIERAEALPERRGAP